MTKNKKIGFTNDNKGCPKFDNSQFLTRNLVN